MESRGVVFWKFVEGVGIQGQSTTRRLSEATISAIDRPGGVAYCYHALQHPLRQFGVKITQIFEFSRKNYFSSWPP
jgi:hypothetical protein